MKTLAIICPVYNEQEAILIFYKRITSVIDQLKTKQNIKVHLFFINNNSSDNTLNQIKTIIKINKNVSVISLSKNVGYQNALFFALQKIIADTYIFIDVDCEDPPELIKLFYEKYLLDNDIVYGERVDRNELYIIKKFRNLFYRIIKFLADDEIILYMAEFSLFSKEVRDCILQENNSFPFIRASIGRIGFNKLGISYKRDRRVAGKTKYNFFKMFLFAAAGILSSTTIFLRIPIFVLPFLWIIFLSLGYMYLKTNNIVYMNIISFIFIFFITFVLSFISIYVARIYKNNLNRPNAFISKTKSLINYKNFVD